MPCGAIRAWTFTKLVGAFLDLAIAFVMLCGSTTAYFASKFLGVLGLNLPCPCNGLFGNPNEAYCLQRFLVEYPASRISSVHSSVRRKFPYDLIYGTEQNCQAKMNKCISFDDRPLELEGAASCSSVSGGRKPCGSTGWELVPKDVASTRVARFDLKRKGIAYQRPKSGIRRRRKIASEYGTNSSAASYDPCGYDLLETPKSSFDFHKQKNGEIVEENDFIITQKPTEGNDQNFTENDWHNEVLQTSLLDLSLSNRIDIDFLEEIGHSDKKEATFTVEKENDMNVLDLEQALKEEKATRAALYIELEKERNAAASAADEAMGMILRLQEEKASIEMQARQYQRMIEEKSAYEADEMNLLKEILLRSEREKYVLEKEVENYKQAILGGEQSVKVLRELQEEYGVNESLPLDSDEDPLTMLREISESIKKRESNERVSKSNTDVAPVEFLNDSSSVRLVNHDADGESKLHDGEIIQDKVVPVDKELPNKIAESQHKEQHIEKQGNDEVGILHGDSDCSKHDQDTHVVDVHVVGNELSTTEPISDKSNLATSSQKHMSEEDFTLLNSAYSNDQSSKIVLDGQHETRSLSNISSRSPPMVSKVNFIRNEKGSSLSDIDLERLKIEKEVELLRHKLKTVQEGIGNSNYSVEQNDEVNAQLQLLDNISNQLNEMQIHQSF